MPERYVAFDVETPNAENNRMSSIGLTVIEDGEIKTSHYALIDPECYFSEFNSALTGIYPEDVEGARTFGEIWDDLRALIDNSVLVAHNAPFDMSVLAKCLKAYNIKWKSTCRYICTCRLARTVFPELPNHKLNTLCDSLDIALEHHNAASDSLACAAIFLECVKMGADTAKATRTYDLENICTVKNR